MIMLEQLSPTVKDFVGSVSSFVTCLGCGHTAERMEPFTCLDVGIPRRGRDNISLYDCLGEEFMEEVVADGWRCVEGCGKSRAKNERFIKEVPNILVIQLKRFMYTSKGYVKDNSKILLPRSVFKLGSEMYRLKGMINHHGSIRAGHYTACIRRHDDWEVCDDTKIKKMGHIERHSELAYIIFLERISHTG